MASSLPLALAAAVLSLASASPPTALGPGHSTSWRLYAGRAGELSLRARAQHCARGLTVRIDGRAQITVRIGQATVEHPIAAVTRGWHRVAARAASGGCRGGVLVGGLLVRATRPAPAGSPVSPLPPPSAGAANPVSQPAPTSPQAPSGAPTPVPGPTVPAPETSAGNPFANKRFYVDPSSNAAQTEASWRAQGRTADADAIAKIAAAPQARWFGDWNGPDPSAAVGGTVSQATAAGALPVLVAYDIPGRDCGGYSAGGAGSADAYRTWIGGFARGIGAAEAIVVLEPDALAGVGCMSAADQQTTLSLLSYAVQTLSANAGTAVYLDAGNAGWQPPSVIAARLQAAGVTQARGFSLNVSNFGATAAEEAYGDTVSGLIGAKHFIVDTSRNGQGPSPDAQWCNPSGRGLGRTATTDTGDPLADALFWIKAPGESDGSCNGGPAAGVWWPDYALGLAQRAAF